MAQIKRKKVSNEATKGQKRGFKQIIKNKMFWIISSIIVVVVAAAIIVPIVVVNALSSDNEKPDYFLETQTLTVDDKTYDVNFEKMSYSGVIEHTDSTNQAMHYDYVFIFATDLSAFYPKDYYSDPDDTTTNQKNETHTKFFNLLIQLQHSIDLYNESHTEKAKLYIVDTTSSDYSENASIMDDSKFGTSGTSYPLFCYYTDDKLVKEVKGNFGSEYREDNSLFYYSSYNYSNFYTVINYAKIFVEKEFVEEEA